MFTDKWLIQTSFRDTRLWRMSSSAVIVFVAVCSKVVIGRLNKAYVYNKSNYIKCVANRPKEKPLLTVSNHYSMVDDTIVSYVLPWKYLFRRDYLRWLPGAKDVCFKTKGETMFFLLGKIIPVERGGGVRQTIMNMCAQRLSMGEWVHLFPEGKLNSEHELMRLKWGVGRLVADSKLCPIVLPYWHVGMDDMFPTQIPYYPRIGHTITIYFGEPIDFETDLQKLKEENKTDEEVWKHITDKVQEAFAKIKAIAEQKHQENLAKSFKSSVS